MHFLNEQFENDGSLYHVNHKDVLGSDCANREEKGILLQTLSLSSSSRNQKIRKWLLNIEFIFKYILMIILLHLPSKSTDGTKLVDQ